MGERVTGIVTKSRQIKNEGFAPSQSTYPDLPFGKIQPNSKEAKIVASNLKFELFALGLVFADRIVDDAYANRQGRWGLIKPIDGYSYPPRYKPVIMSPKEPDAYNFMGKMMETTLQASVRKEVNALQVREGNPKIISAFQRLEILTWFLHEIIPDRRQIPGVQAFLEEGIGTNCDVMSGLLEVTDTLGSELAPDEFAKIAHNSYPFVLELASDHAGIGITLIQLLKGFPGDKFYPFNVANFQIVGEGDKRRLGFSELGEIAAEHHKRKQQILLESLEIISPVVGCLAQGNLSGDGSPIQKQWAWNSTIATEIFAERRQRRPAFIQ